MADRRAFRPTVAPLDDRVVPSHIGRGPGPTATGPARRAIRLLSDVAPEPGNRYFAIDSWMLWHTRDVVAASTRDPRVVFLGDSITFFWGDVDRFGVATDLWLRDFAPLGAVNSGIPGDGTRNVLWRVQNGELGGRPRAVVLMVGVNDLIWGDTPEQVVAGVDAVLRAIRSQSPGTRVLLLGLLPVDRPPTDPLNLAIDDVDAGLGRFARRGAVTYLDLHDQFLNPDGTVRSDLFLAGGIHPNVAGYQVLADGIAGPLGRTLGPSARSR